MISKFLLLGRDSVCTWRLVLVYRDTQHFGADRDCRFLRLRQRSGVFDQRNPEAEIYVLRKDHTTGKFIPKSFRVSWAGETVSSCLG